jgi:3-oxoacyl-[acyl-carrier-protein] synthase III
LHCDELSIFELLKSAAKKLLDHNKINKNEIQYLIHAHTAQILSPFGSSLVQEIKSALGLDQAIAFGTSSHKCVSALKMLEVMSVVLDEQDNKSALILTGEIGFTPELRLIPRSSISGDAAAIALIKNDGVEHVLLGIEIYHLEGYCRGYYLTDEELNRFESQFLQVMNQTITRALIKAGIKLSDVAVILPHNVNLPVWKSIAKNLGVSYKKIYSKNISYFGHCFASDSFINLALALENKALKKGDYYLMVGCGMGFFFACAVFQF